MDSPSVAAVQVFRDFTDPALDLARCTHCDEVTRVHASAIPGVAHPSHCPRCGMPLPRGSSDAAALADYSASREIPETRPRG